MSSFRWGRLRLRSFRGFVSMFLVGVGLCLTLAACNSAPNSTATSDSASPAQGGTVNLTLVSYAVTQAAYEQIIPKFAAKWKADHNQEVVFDQSYGGSGSQTRAVIDGLEADIVALALALDTQKIEKAGLIDTGWETEAPNNSIVHKSVAALVTREGNPKGIKAVRSDQTRRTGDHSQPQNLGRCALELHGAVGGDYPNRRYRRQGARVYLASVQKRARTAQGCPRIHRCLL